METQNQETSLMDFDSGAVRDMATRLAAMKGKLDVVQQFFREVMVTEVDYGVIDGTKKPTLYKPGAEKLCELYGFTIEIAHKHEERDFKTGFYLAVITIRLIHRASGTVVAEGVGEANVYEAKYRWRWVSEKDLPLNLDPYTLVSKEVDGRNGPYVKYRIENNDLFDQWNTVLKMAKKRALVDATLSATRSSGIFTQSEDDFEAFIEGEEDGQTGEPKAAKAAKLNPKDLAVKVPFGEYKGRTLGELMKEKPSELKYMAEKAFSDTVRKAASNLLRVMEAQQNSSNTNNQTPSPGDDDIPFDSLFKGGEPR